MPQLKYFLDFVYSQWWLEKKKKKSLSCVPAVPTTQTRLKNEQQHLLVFPNTRLILHQPLSCSNLNHMRTSIYCLRASPQTNEPFSHAVIKVHQQSNNKGALYTGLHLEETGLGVNTPTLSGTCINGLCIMHSMLYLFCLAHQSSPHEAPVLGLSPNIFCVFFLPPTGKHKPHQ